MPTTISEQQQSQLKIYPNPFEEHLNLYSPGGLLIIYDLSGRIVFETELADGMQTIHPIIASGFYLLKIYTRDQIFLSRITKESY